MKSNKFTAATTRLGLIGLMKIAQRLQKEAPGSPAADAAEVAIDAEQIRVAEEAYAADPWPTIQER